MASDSFDGAYVPDRIPEEDLSYFAKGNHGERVGWGDTPAVVVVDMTEEFTSSDYAAGRSDTGERAVAANARLLDAARDAEVPVFFTRPCAAEPDGFLGATKKKKSARSEREREEANEIHPELVPVEGEILIDKPRASAFFQTELSLFLRHHGVDTVLVTGMTTSGCVRASVVDAHSWGFRTIIPEECTADRSVISHEVNLFDMDMKYADVTPVDDVIDRLG